MTEVELHTDTRRLSVRFDDGMRGEYPFVWLRDNDPAGLHPDTQERLFDLGTVRIDTAPRAVRCDGATLELDWPDAAVPSRFDLGWLRAHRPGHATADAAALARIPWPAGMDAGAIPRVAARDLLASDTALLDWMRGLRTTGVSLVEGVQDAEAGAAVARRISFLRETNFGVTFEVRSMPKANNLAYTALALPMHTDLPNQELPPGFQFLHCLANEAAGGGSILADGVALAESLRADDPEAFSLLAGTPIPFRFHDATHDIRVRRPVIRLDEDGAVDEVAVSPHLADVLDIAPDLMEPFYRAYQMFLRLCQDPARRVTLKLRQGEMVVFDNRRILHGREAFDPSTGFRHLRGFYVDRQELDSRLRVLSRAINPS